MNYNWHGNFYVEPTKKHFYPLHFHVLNLPYDEYILCFSVRLFVSNKSQSAELIGPKIFEGPHVTPNIFNNLLLTKFDLGKF